MIAIPAGENTKLVAAYVAEKTGCDFQEGMYQSFAVLDDQGQFCAGVVFHEYRGHDVQMSTATETPLAWKPHVLKAIFTYAFKQLGCVRATAFTKKSNRRARSFLEGLGFQLEGRIRLGHDGVKDALIYGLLASECVYIQEVVDGPGTDQSDAEGRGADAGGVHAVSVDTPEVGQPQEHTDIQSDSEAVREPVELFSF